MTLCVRTGAWKPEVLSWLEANREAIEAEVIKILLQRMMPVSSEIPEGANTGGRTVFYYPFKEVTDDS